MPDFLTLQTTTANPTYITVIFTLLLSFLLSILVAVSYVKSFRGLSYSRNYVQSLVLSSLVASVIMQAIGDNLARGLGMIGALAIIRFRTNFKDPRDIIFMFASLAAGIACGVYAYAVGVCGTIGFCIAVLILYYSPFQTGSFFDGMLRFNISANSQNKNLIEHSLNRHCKAFALITLRELAQGERWDYAYHIKLKNSASKQAVLEELQRIDTISGLSLLFQENTIEL